MALTYRKVKGSALTIDELDANFAHFTGSHSITGSLTVSGSIIPSEVNGTLGTATAPWKELFVDGGTIYFISGSSSGSLSWNSGSGFDFGSGSVSGSFTGSANLTGSFTGSANLTGSFTGSANLTGSFTGSANLTGSFTGSANLTGSFTGSFSGSVDTQFNSGSCLIGCTSSVVPTGNRPEGTFEFVASGSEYFMFVYLGGAWRSGSLS